METATGILTAFLIGIVAASVGSSFLESEKVATLESRVRLRDAQIDALYFTIETAHLKLNRQ